MPYIYTMPKPKKYITAKEWGDKLSPPISLRRVHALFEEGRIEGAIKPQRDILIPDGAPDPRKRVGRPALNADNIRRIKE